MNDLLKLAMTTHGGLERWNLARQISATLHPSGASFQARGPIGQAFTEQSTRITVDTRMQKVTLDPFLRPGQTGLYTPGRTSILDSNGTVLEALDDPRGSLKALAPGSAWSGPQIIYFIGYSMWMYMTLPFNFRLDGIIAEEVEPLVEDGETWRALKITYPASFPSHATEQTHYFDETGIMRRQDYTVDVRQDLSAAHYISDCRMFDGFLFPTKRRIFPCGPDRAPMRDRPLISADLEDFRVVFDAAP